ncbi:MAG: hypothetical protein ACREC4_10735, partial [Methylocella sp.]
MVFRPCAMIPFCCRQRSCYASIRSNRIGAIQDRQQAARAMPPPRRRTFQSFREPSWTAERIVQKFNSLAEYATKRFR